MKLINNFYYLVKVNLMILNYTCGCDRGCCDFNDYGYLLGCILHHFSLNIYLQMFEKYLLLNFFII